jgi:hypothetical protein
MARSPANPYAPVRPNPAREWLKKRAAAASAAASVPPPPPVLSGELLDLSLLVSCLSDRQQCWLIARLQPLIAQRCLPRQKPRWIIPLCARFPLFASPRSRLIYLRARLCDELAAGLLIAATPLSRLSRPARNRALIERAEAIGRLAESLRDQPDAAPLEQELQRALARLAR